jgi:hypothetical protein
VTIAALASILFPAVGWACACGCGVFDVGTSSMLPSGPGPMAFLSYAYEDQNHNWSGSSSAPSENNDDKKIETHFLSLGLQYMFDRSWGLQVELPYDFRSFQKQEEAGNIVTRNWSQFGDVRIRGIYTGFFPDMSAGLTLGLKLPTGNFRFDPEVVDRDTQLGTGSTDILFGGFYRKHLDQIGQWDGFAQFESDIPVLIEDEYRPGAELNAAAGIIYNGLSLGSVGVAPLAQVIYSGRTSDGGANSASPVASGYQRILISPGVEFHVGQVRIYADAEFPVYQYVTGNQLVAPVMFKMSLSWMF